MIKAIFFDIDGTLVSFNTHKVSNASKIAIKKLKEKGIKVFIATGRIKLQVDNLDDLEFDGYITANGHDCYVDNKEIYKNAISKETIYSLIDYLKNKEKFPCSIMTNNGIFINYIEEGLNEKKFYEVYYFIINTDITFNWFSIRYFISKYLNRSH